MFHMKLVTTSQRFSNYSKPQTREKLHYYTITKQHAQWAWKKCQGEHHQKKTSSIHLSFEVTLTDQGSLKTSLGGIRFSDFNTITKYPEVKFLSVLFLLLLLHSVAHLQMDHDQRKKRLKWPISEACKTCVFVWGAGHLAFWRQDRLGFL